MPISSIEGVSSSLTSSRKSIADNFDTFLNLLTAQLKHQNPLDPLDTNQFTQQMVEFTSVEQQLKTNEFLEALTLSASNGGNIEAVTFIGKSISATGANATLSGGGAQWTFSANRSAPDTEITIRDSLGNTVYTESTSLASGDGQYVWHGKDSAGNQMADGNYSITISAKDSNGNNVPVQTQISGTVTGVDLSGSEPVLIVGGSEVKLSSVQSVQIAA